MVTDFYSILGIEEDATQEDVKRAYRKLAKELHPDTNKEDPKSAAERFKHIKEAYEVLSNPLRREKYDLNLLREQGKNPSQQSQSQSFFTYRGPPLAPQRGADVKLNFEISFSESYHGVKKNVNVNMPVMCSYCGGSGASPNTPVSQCPTCKGSGALLAPVQTPQGLMNQRVVCSTCNGRGILMQQFCLMCSGVGLVNGMDQVPVSLPPGVEDGAVLKLTQKGGHGLGNGPRGDLYITIKVSEESNMKRMDNDLYIDEYISFPKAVFGGQHRINTLDGRRTLRIPSGTKSKTEFMIEGEGFPDPVNGEHGNLYVVVHVDTPAKLNDEARKALKRYALESGENVDDLGV